MIKIRKHGKFVLYKYLTGCEKCGCEFYFTHGDYGGIKGKDPGSRDTRGCGGSVPSVSPEEKDARQRGQGKRAGAPCGADPRAGYDGACA